MNSLAIPIAFCLMSILLLWFIIGAKGKWTIKALAIVFYIYFAVVVWFSLYTYLGWPSKDPLPNKYVIYWAQIEEPNPASEGAIYFWTAELESNKNANFLYLLKYNNRKSEPRVYQIPYSRSLHKNVQKMMEDIKKGSVYIGGEKEGTGSKADGKDPLNDKGQFSFSYKSKDQYLFPLPPPKIPEKMK